jgi:signal transduction histidine kinase
LFSKISVIMRGPGQLFALVLPDARRYRTYPAGSADRDASRAGGSGSIDAVPITSSPRRLLVAAFLVPALLFLIVAWHDRALVLEDAKRDVLRTVAIFEQHARNVFETHVLVAAQINERVRGMTWEEIGNSDQLRQNLKSICDQYPQVQSLWLLDPAGIVRNSSLDLPDTPIVSADRDFFVTLREKDVGTFISSPMIGRMNGFVNFNLARRRTGRSNEFDGVIVVSIRPPYFVQFWRNVISRLDRSAMLLVRADGAVLAREPFPNYEASKLSPDSRLMRAITQADAGSYHAISPIDGVERIFAYRKVDRFPVYVGHGVAVEDALSVWRQHLFLYGSFFALATLGLGLMAAAMRHASREANALNRWCAAARQLAEEAERRAATEEQLRQSQKMDALGQMTGGVAHDFNNVLSIITGNLELVKLRTTDPRSVHLIDRALKGAESAEKSISSLLSFARRQPLQLERFDLNKALEDMAELMRQALGSKIHLNMVLSPTLGEIEADPNQTSLAILNIVVNARDAMPKGGRLQIETANQVLTGKPDGLVGSFVAARFADSGKGIPRHLLSRVFEPFFTTKNRGEGTGLGLSMVYGFANQSGGTVAIDSTVGQGTAMTLYLPRAGAAQR